MCILKQPKTVLEDLSLEEMTFIHPLRALSGLSPSDRAREMEAWKIRKSGNCGDKRDHSSLGISQSVLLGWNISCN